MTETPRLSGDECALDCNHELPEIVTIYNDEDLRWVGRQNARVVCSEDEADQLTDRLIG